MATKRWTILDKAAKTRKEYSANYQAYTEEQYIKLLEGCGFRTVDFVPALTGNPEDRSEDWLVVVATT